MTKIEKESKKQPKIEKQSNGIMGGSRPGAGRKAGIRNKKTLAVITAVENSGETPLDYMLTVMRNVANEPHVRLDAAKSAAPYVHSKLASIEVNAEISGKLEISKIERVIVDPK